MSFQSEKIKQRLIRRKLDRENQTHNTISSRIYSGQIFPLSDVQIDYLEKYVGLFDPTIWRFGKYIIPGWCKPISLYCIESRQMFNMLRSHGDPTAVGKLWSPSKLLPLLILNYQMLKLPFISDFISGTTVLEVGAGWCGTAGIAASRRGARSVILTDGERIMVECLQVNAQIESGAVDDGGVVSTGEQLNPPDEKDTSNTVNPHEIPPPVRIQAKLLRWGCEADACSILDDLRCDFHGTGVDTVLGCDTLYTDVDQLLATIHSHLHARNILFCWERRLHRIESEQRFLQLLPELGYSKVVYHETKMLSVVSECARELCSVDLGGGGDGHSGGEGGSLEGRRVWADAVAEACSEIRRGLDDPAGDLILLAATRP